MLNKSFIDGLKEKAQKSLDDIKIEASKIQDRVEKKLNEEISEQNNLGNKDENFISNSTINKAAQLLLEKSTKQAEQLIYKYVRPYDVHEIIDACRAKEIISDLMGKMKSVIKNEQYINDLIILHMNIEQYKTASEFINQLSESAEKNNLIACNNIANLDDNSFIINFERLQDIILDLKLYSISKRYVNLCISQQDYKKAKPILELCCELNPCSLSDQVALLECYEQLGEYEHHEIQKVIISNLQEGK